MYFLCIITLLDFALWVLFFSGRKFFLFHPWMNALSSLMQLPATEVRDKRASPLILGDSVPLMPLPTLSPELWKSLVSISGFSILSDASVAFPCGVSDPQIFHSFLKVLSYSHSFLKVVSFLYLWGKRDFRIMLVHCLQQRHHIWSVLKAFILAYSWKPFLNYLHGNGVFSNHYTTNSWVLERKAKSHYTCNIWSNTGPDWAGGEDGRSR